MINNNFRGIELKASSFILKFGVTALLLLAATALTGCDISPEKHHDIQVKLFSDTEGHLILRLAKLQTQSFDERGALI